jgi:hypothetical protein
LQNAEIRQNFTRREPPRHPTSRNDATRPHVASLVQAPPARHGMTSGVLHAATAVSRLPNNHQSGCTGALPPFAGIKASSTPINAASAAIEGTSTAIE